MWAELSSFLSNGDVYVGNFLSCSKGVKDPLEVPEVRCSRLTTGTSGTPSGGLRKGQSPFELLGGLSGFLSRCCRGLRSCVEWVPELEDSSPVLTWILGYFCSLPRGVIPRLQSGHVRALSSRALAAVSRFPSCGSRDQGLSLEAFPRFFPMRLSHSAVPRVTVV